MVKAARRGNGVDAKAATAGKIAKVEVTEFEANVFGPHITAFDRACVVAIVELQVRYALVTELCIQATDPYTDIPPRVIIGDDRSAGYETNNKC